MNFDTILIFAIWTDPLLHRQTACIKLVFMHFGDVLILFY